VSGPLWQPSPERIAATHLAAFLRRVEADWGVSARDYAELWRWSVARPEQFWSSVWDFAGIVAETRGERVVEDAERMPGARWFPGARLNFAENLLRGRGAGPALVFRDERGRRRTLAHDALRARVSRLARFLREHGLRPGDRVAACLPNAPEAVEAMLAATSLGAVWSSCSPDFGVEGILDRFGQIEPRVLFGADGYFYAGKRHDTRERLAEVASRLPSVETLVLVDFAGERASPALRGAHAHEEIASQGEAAEIEFEHLPFDHPLYILFSSGTTGAPKCIVHGAGGTLLQHRKEHLLQVDVHPGDRLFYFTTCGWMMWNWLVSALASGATLALYDGSPFHPDGNVLWDLARQERITIFGTSAKYLDACAKAGLEPARSHELPSLRTILSTGSPLAPEGFDWVYAKVKRDVALASISGGTDIISCFAGGNPIGPVFRGELQARGLGMAVEVFDEQGRPVRERQGELVCTAPFPSMPVGFWNDPDGRRYRAAYFERYPGVWHHGDWVELTAHDGLVMHGRSDAVLNPGGVRIGTAEIYRVVEQIDDVLESLAIGQAWEGDTRVVLFVRLREGAVLDDALRQRIRERIRANTTPRHVPARIVQVADVPRTKSGKIVELAVRDVVHGRPVPNKEALANPEALDHFANRPELER
jgi:acetoacetyl-CoA synthetase